MSRRLGLLLTFTLLLGLATGCGQSGGSGAAQETPPPTETSSGEEAPASPSQGAETEAAEDLSLSSVTSGLQSLDSYATHFRMAFEGSTADEAESGEAGSRLFEIDTEYVREPLAQHVVVGRGEGESVEVFLVGGRQYVVYEGGRCVYALAKGVDAMNTEFFEPSDIIGEVSNARRVQPDERVNGILCRHYTFDQTVGGSGEFTQVEGEVWIAVEGDYVVKYTLQAEGQDPDTGEEGHFELEYEVRDVHASIVIEAPTDCQPAGNELPGMLSPTD